MSDTKKPDRTGQPAATKRRRLIFGFEVATVPMILSIDTFLGQPACRVCKVNDPDAVVCDACADVSRDVFDDPPGTLNYIAGYLRDEEFAKVSLEYALVAEELDAMALRLRKLPAPEGDQ